MNMFKNKSLSAKFYKEPAMVEEVYTGYLRKSPGQPALLKTFTSWKRRFFVLSKTGEDDYHLTYYTNEKRDKSLGEIDLSKIIMIFTGLETHQMQDWIQKHFKCPPSSVLFLRVEDNTHKNSRDYFLIGKNSDYVEGWYKALNTQITNKQRQTFDTLEDTRSRSTSEPMNSSEEKVEDQSDERWSAPELMSSPPPTPDHYDYPRKFSLPPVPVERKISVNEDKDEKDGEEDESSEDSNEYMFMASVKKELEDVQQEADTACIQTNTSINGHESFVCNVAVNQDTDEENKRMSTDERQSQPRLLNFNGNCASTEKVEAPLNNSVSECRQIQDSHLFHKGDQILAFNDLLIDTVEEIQTYLRRLSKSLNSEI